MIHLFSRATPGLAQFTSNHLRKFCDRNSVRILRRLLAVPNSTIVNYTGIPAKLPRSRSSPSPPPSQRSGSQRGARRAVAVQRNRRPSIAASPSYDWSTSYQAGSSGYVTAYIFVISLFHVVLHSSAASSASTDDGDTTTDTDNDRTTLRGRPTSHSRPRLHSAVVKPSTTDAPKTRRGSVSSTSGSSGRHRLQPVRISFTRSKSPLPPTRAINGNHPSTSLRKASPVPSRIKQGINYQHILPPAFYFSFRIPFTKAVHRFYIDSSEACEAILLLVSMVFAAKSLAKYRTETWTSIGGWCLVSVLNS